MPLPVKGNLAGFDFREIENIVDDLEKVSGCTRHFVQRIPNADRLSEKFPRRISKNFFELVIAANDPTIPKQYNANRGGVKDRQLIDTFLSNLT